MLIIIIGRANTGKSTLSKYLTLKYNFVELTLANELKDHVSSKYKLDRNLLSGDTDYSRKWREEFLPEIGMTPRQMLQQEGTIMRNTDVDYFIKKLLTKLDSHLKTTDVVISDCRFQNEYEYFKLHYDPLIIKLSRKDNDMYFESEDQIDDMNCEINDELPNIMKDIDSIITKYK